MYQKIEGGKMITSNRQSSSKSGSSRKAQSERRTISGGGAAAGSVRLRKPVKSAHSQPFKRIWMLRRCLELMREKAWI